MQSCAGNCLEEHLPALAPLIGAQYDDHYSGESGSLTFDSGATLQLGQPSENLFAVEAASLYSGVMSVKEQDKSSVRSCILVAL